MVELQLPRHFVKTRARVLEHGGDAQEEKKLASVLAVPNRHAVCAADLGELLRLIGFCINAELAPECASCIAAEVDVHKRADIQRFAEKDNCLARSGAKELSDGRRRCFPSDNVDLLHLHLRRLARPSNYTFGGEA